MSGSSGFTLADALLGIETDITAAATGLSRFTLADALLGIETSSIKWTKC